MEHPREIDLTDAALLAGLGGHGGAKKELAVDSQPEYKPHKKSRI